MAPSIDYHKLEEGLRDPQAVVAVRLEHVRLNPLAANRAEATFIPIRASRTLNSILPKLTTARALMLEEQVELLLRAVAANCTQLPFCLHAVPEGRIVLVRVLVREVAVELPLVLLLHLVQLPVQVTKKGITAHHHARHSAATIGAGETQDMLAIQALGRWRSLRVVERYTHPKAERSAAGDLEAQTWLDQPPVS